MKLSIVKPLHKGHVGTNTWYHITMVAATVRGLGSLYEFNHFVRCREVVLF